MQRWIWLLWLAMGVLLAGSITDWRFGLPGALIVACAAVLAYWTSPWAYGRSRKRREVLALPDAERRVVVYWRPGCLYCQRLRGALGAGGKAAHWINIWQDAEAAAFVRSVNGGNETVPTVVIDGEARTNPDPSVVRAALDA